MLGGKDLVEMKVVAVGHGLGEVELGALLPDDPSALMLGRLSVSRGLGVLTVARAIGVATVDRGQAHVTAPRAAKRSSRHSSVSSTSRR